MGQGRFHAMTGRLGIGHGDCKRESGPTERNEAGTVTNVFDCEARQAKERDGE